MKDDTKSFILKSALSDEIINFHCLLDIDNFGEYNYKFTYEKGNEIIEKLTHLGNEIIEPKYWLRVGSDEFYFSLNEKEIDEQSMLFKFMRKIQNELDITVSIGIVRGNSNLNHQSLFQRLKYNVQIAKLNGKNKISLQ